MKRVILAIALCMMLAVAANAQYTGPWTQTWDFSNGLQGWYKVSGQGYWVDSWAPNGPTLPDNNPSGGGWGNLYVPDGTVFRYDLATPTNNFVLQADIYVPNLMPLGIHSSLPGNGIQGTGIGAINAADGKWIGAGGRHNPDGIRGKDKTWDNTNRERSWIMAEDGKSKTDYPYWDAWVTVQIDYNVSNAGKWSYAFYTPWQSPVHPSPGWWVSGLYDIHPNSANQFWSQIQLGAVVPDTISWTQAQIDNVKFFDANAPIPEPGTMVALGSGLVGLAGFAIRRRK